MATDEQVAKIRQLANRCIPLPDCPIKKQHAQASRVFMAKEFTKLLDDEVNSLRGMAGNAAGA